MIHVARSKSVHAFHIAAFVALGAVLGLFPAVTVQASGVPRGGIERRSVTAEGHAASAEPASEGGC